MGAWNKAVRFPVQRGNSASRYNHGSTFFETLHAQGNGDIASHQNGILTRIDKKKLVELDKERRIGMK